MRRCGCGRNHTSNTCSEVESSIFILIEIVYILVSRNYLSGRLLFMSIQLRWVNKKRRLDIQGGIVLDGFPSSGLVNAIATECLIRSLKTELVAVLDSSEFPPLSIVIDHSPQFPARLYVNESLKVSFFVSELDIYPSMQKAAARKIMQWAVENQSKTIVSSAGITAKGKDQMASSSLSEIYALGSTVSARGMITKEGFEHFQAGTITGIPATLLNEGALMGLDVIVLLVKTSMNGPDFRAAALLSQALTKIVPGIYCDVETLMGEGEVIEDNIKAIRDNLNKISPYG